MRTLRYDAISYVMENGNPFHRLKLARILSQQGENGPLVDELLSLQNSDGGWPWRLEDGNPSGVSDTAKTLELLAGLGVDPGSGPIRKAVSYLLDLQNEDGGWSESPELDGIVPEEWTWVSTRHSGYQTADAVNALAEAGYSGGKINMDLDFLRVAQNDEGGWPSHVGPDSRKKTDSATTDHIVFAFLRHGYPRDSSVIRKAEEMLLEKRRLTDSPVNVATALSALTALGHPPDDEYVSELVDWLIEAQRSDGGWNWFGDLPSNPSLTVDCLEQLSTFVEIDGNGLE